jgi:MFS family permease
MADVITREKGFVASTALDWSLLETAIPLSLVFILLGASASVLGNWQNQIGVRKALLYSSCAFGGGLVLGSIGIYTHSLPLVYLGYGVIGGLGTGLAYTPPIQTLLQWFPDKKGIASGLTIAGFGSGALLFTPAAQYLMKKFTVLPEYIGPTKDFILKNVDGRYYTDLNGVSVEVIEAVTSDLAKLPYQLSEGLYIVGSGSTGAAPALAVMGVTYFAVILASALAIKKPHSSYIPPQAAITSSIGDNIQKTCLEKETNALSPLAPLEISRDEAIRFVVGS